MQRSLEREKRGGVEHFVTGQHHAVIVGEDNALYGAMSFVNVLGQVILVLCQKKAGSTEWVPTGVVRRAAMEIDLGPGKLPKEFELTEKMIEALNAAEERYEERFNA